MRFVTTEFSFVAFLDDPVTGKKIRKSIYGDREKDVRRRVTEIQNALDNGTYQEPSKMKVHEWLEEWITTFCAHKLKPYTIAAYRGIIKNHLNPAIGEMKLQDIRGLHIQRIYNRMISNDASPKTVKNIGAVAHKAFNVAIKQGLISVNPCDAAEFPKMERKEIKPLTDAEIPVFLNAIKGDPLENAYALCLFSGLREGECLGLSWDQVNFEKQTLVISQQLQRGKNKGGQYYIASSTKSGRSRTIKPPSIAFEYLKSERRRQLSNQISAGAEWNNEHYLVFTTDKGKN